jgi:hypothetical protein
MLGAGVRLWRAVTLELHVPYFLVRFSVEDGPAWVSQTTLLWREEDVVEFCEVVQMDPHQQVLQIARLSPPKEGVQDGWDMMTLAEVWKGTHLKTEQPTIVFVTKNGERVASRGSKAHDAEIGLVEQVYP